MHDLAEVRRKVALAVSVTEYFLRRPIETVLDIGCGEGAWFLHLRALRRNVHYIGLDSSDYAVQRFGRQRNIHKSSFAALRSVKGSHDLVVCSDVLHYVHDDEISRGLPHLARLTEGMAFIEVLTRDDDIVGDMEALIRRSPSWYRRRFSQAGLVQAGPYCWLPRNGESAAALEIMR